MRPWIVMLPLLLAVPAEAGTDKMRQYQHQAGRSLKDYINDGYEIKSITTRESVSDFNYFLQKGTDFVWCYEFTSSIGGQEVLREIHCAALVQPFPYQ